MQGVNIMKKFAYIIFFLVLSVSFVMVYYAGYYYATKKIDKTDSVKYTNETVEDSTEDAEAADSSSKDVVTKDTEYIIESYNLETDDLAKKTSDLPTALIGLNREEVINYISKNINEFSSDDEEVINVQLISFSSKSVVLRKSYNDISTESYKYWLKDVDGYITVYKADKTTVYFNTDINIALLPDDVKNEIQEGKYIKDIHELYSFLESYSS